MSAALSLTAAPEAGDPVDPAPRPRPERVPLTGRSVTLEPLTAAHADALWPLAETAAESWAYLPMGPFPDATAFRGYLRFASLSKDEILWAVRPHGPDGAPGPAQGWLALLDIRPGDAAIELGNIWFPPPLARTRAATEAMALLLGHAFGLGYRRVAWKCNSLHLASRRAAERLGFRLEGILRAHMVVRGRRRDTAYFGLLDQEWPSRQAALTAWLADANFGTDGQARCSLMRPVP